MTLAARRSRRRPSPSRRGLAPAATSPMCCCVYVDGLVAYGYATGRIVPGGGRARADRAAAAEGGVAGLAAGRRHGVGGGLLGVEWLGVRVGRRDAGCRSPRAPRPGCPGAGRAGPTATPGWRVAGSSTTTSRRYDMPDAPIARALAGHWSSLALRGVCALVFGILSFIWPGLSLDDPGADLGRVRADRRRRWRWSRASGRRSGRWRSSG